MRRVFALVPAYLLLGCIFTEDPEHFYFMHYLVPFFAAIFVYDTYAKMQHVFIVFFIVSIVLYNPLIPTRYYMQTAWMFFDVIFGGAFLLKAIIWGKVEADAVSDQEIRLSARRAAAKENARKFKIVSYKVKIDR